VGQLAPYRFLARAPHKKKADTGERDRLFWPVASGVLADAAVLIDLSAI
jgi:hypothetical protein